MIYSIIGAINFICYIDVLCFVRTQKFKAEGNVALHRGGMTKLVLAVTGVFTVHG